MLLLLFLITLLLLLGLRIELSFRLFFRFFEWACVLLRRQFLGFLIILWLGFWSFFNFLFLATGRRNSCGYSWSSFAALFLLQYLLILLLEVVPSSIHLCLSLFGELKCSLPLLLPLFTLPFLFIFWFLFIFEQLLKFSLFLLVQNVSGCSLLFSSYFGFSFS